MSDHIMKFWRDELPEIEEDGTVIKGGMFHHQKKWWDLKNFIKALIAGYGSGKTFIGGKRTIALALHNAPAPALIVSPSYKMAKRTVIPMIRALLNGKKTIHPELWYKENKSDHEFRIRFKGREGLIWIGSGDDPQSLKGPNVGSTWIDEPFIQDEAVLLESMARTRDPAAKLLEITLTGTPEQLNWGYDICEGEKRDDYDVGIVHAHTRMNLALDRAYPDRLEEALTPEAADAYLAGQFINLTSGRTYYGFSRDRNIVTLPDPMGELNVGMDFNINPMAAIIFWISGNHMHIVAELELPNADTYKMCDTLLEKFVFPDRHEHAGKCRIQKIFPDATGVARKTSAPYGRSDFTIIESFKYILDAPSVNPNVRDRENAVNGKFNPKKGDPSLTIDPSCKKLAGYLEKYTEENKNKQLYKSMSHLLDAMGYPVHRLFPVYRPTLVTKNLMGT